MAKYLIKFYFKVYKGKHQCLAITLSSLLRALVISTLLTYKKIVQVISRRLLKSFRVSQNICSSRFSKMGWKEGTYASSPKMDTSRQGP